MPHPGMKVATNPKFDGSLQGKSHIPAKVPFQHQLNLMVFETKYIYCNLIKQKSLFVCLISETSERIWEILFAFDSLTVVEDYKIFKTMLRALGAEQT